MSPEERLAAYDEAVDVLNNYTAQEAAKIGNAQRSLGTLAEAVASPSGQTSGLANYTYNRMIRPTVDSLAASLATEGKSQQLSNKLQNDLKAAKNRYEDAKNRYTVASTAPRRTVSPTSPSNPTNTNLWKGETTDTEVTGQPSKVPARGSIIGVGYPDHLGGVWRITVADGNGGSKSYDYSANSKEDAINKWANDHLAEYRPEEAKQRFIETINQNETVKRWLGM